MIETFLLPDLPTGQLDLDNPSLRLSSQVILGCIKLTVKATNHIHLLILLDPLKEEIEDLSITNHWKLHQIL